MVDINKKYSEVNSIDPFNWFEALTSREINWPNLVWLSCQWVTCACGNQCAAIPRDGDGEPKDEKLRQLGIDFNHAIEAQNVSWSLDILRCIEHRSTQILNEMGLLK